MTDHDDLGTITPLQSGTLVDVTIKGVQVEHEGDRGTVIIRDEHGIHYLMPPQAAIKRTDLTNPIDAATLQGGISKTLAYLDHMEAEGYIPPYIASTVRKQFGMPPRHWPPQAGDVWSDGCPFTDLWFARKLQANGPGWNETAIVMTCVEADMRFYSPDEFLDAGGELTLVYRKDGGQ